MSNPEGKMKKNMQRFNICFDFSIPEHRQVIEKLNGLKERQKAKYIAKAVLHYMNFEEQSVTLPKMESNDKIDLIDEDKEIKKVQISEMLKLFK